MAVQPLQQAYNFFGFHAPIIQFQRISAIHAGTNELAAPAVYSTLDLSQPTSREIKWEGEVSLESGGTLNAMRFITKNILAVVPERATTIDWLIDYLVLPLGAPIEVRSGDVVKVAFGYLAGGSLRSLERSMRAVRVGRETVRGEP